MDLDCISDSGINLNPDLSGILYVDRIRLNFTAKLIYGQLGIREFNETSGKKYKLNREMMQIISHASTESPCFCVEKKIHLQ